MTLGGSDELRARAAQNSQAASLPDTAQIFRPGTPVPNEDFGQDQTYTEIDIVPAAYWPLSGTEAIAMHILDVIMHNQVALPGDTNINEHDEIVYTVTQNGSIHHFAVVDVADRSRERLRIVGVTEYVFNQSTTFAHS